VVNLWVSIASWGSNSGFETMFHQSFTLETYLKSKEKSLHIWKKDFLLWEHLLSTSSSVQILGSYSCQTILPLTESWSRPIHPWNLYDVLIFFFLDIVRGVQRVFQVICERKNAFGCSRSRSLDGVWHCYYMLPECAYPLFEVYYTYAIGDKWCALLSSAEENLSATRTISRR